MYHYVTMNIVFTASYVQIFGTCLRRIHLPHLVSSWQFRQLDTSSYCFYSLIKSRWIASANRALLLLNLPIGSAYPKARRTIIGSPAPLKNTLHSFVAAADAEIQRTLDHAPSGIPASLDDSCDHFLLRDVPTITIPTPSCRLRPATDRTSQPGNRWNSRSRAAHRERCLRPFTPNEILGEEGHTKLVLQAAPANSNATECSHRIRRTFSIQLLACQLSAGTPTNATK